MSRDNDSRLVSEGLGLGAIWLSEKTVNLYDNTSVDAPYNWNCSNVNQILERPQNRPPSSRYMWIRTSDLRYELAIQRQGRVTGVYGVFVS